MKRLLAVLLILALPAGAAQPSGCGVLCGSWRLDAAASTAVAPVVDTALRSYSAPRARRVPRSQRSLEGMPENTADQLDAEMEHSLGPILNRPVRADLRLELMSLLEPPAQLNLESRGPDLVIQGDSQMTRKLSPGTPRTRVNTYGTATILASWKSNRLTISERYDRKNRYYETYALQAADGSLLVTRSVQRPGLKPLKLQAVYRRG
jgi:hypothetical protein